VRTEAWRAPARALQNVETWLKSGRPGGTTLQDYEGQPPKLNKGEDVLSALERTRRRGRELQADLHRIESAPYPSSHAKRRMREMVEQLAMRCGANVSGLIEHGDGKLEFKRELLRVQMHNIPKAPAAIGYLETVDPCAVIAWLLKETLIKRLDAEIDSEADDKAALSEEARAMAAAEAQGDLLAVERDEAALVWQAQAQNLPCEHRADCAPCAILGCVLLTAPRAAPASGSSAEHVWDFVRSGAPR
jgi:hypothetical protein